MKVHSNFMAVLCYLVTVLLLYLIGDVFNISILQLAKSSYLYGSLLQRFTHSLLPFLFASPVYIIVHYKLKQI